MYMSKQTKNYSYSTLLKCSNGHRTWIRSRGEECSECQKEKTVKTAKKLLEIQSNLNRQSIEQSIVETNKNFHTSKEKFLQKESGGLFLGKSNEYMIKSR